MHARSEGYGETARLCRFTIAFAAGIVRRELVSAELTALGLACTDIMSCVSFCLFVWLDALGPSQQLWSCRDGQFTK